MDLSIYFYIGEYLSATRSRFPALFVRMAGFPCRADVLMAVLDWYDTSYHVATRSPSVLP